MVKRFLTSEERDLIKTLVIGTSKENEIISKLSLYRVEEIKVQGKYQLLFLEENNENRIPGPILVEGVFYDTDDTKTSVLILLDTNENVYKLDIWKTNSTPLNKYPDPQKIKVYKEQIGRHLTEQEKTLIKTIIAGTSKESEILQRLPFYLVEDMDDGGMGSLLFLGKARERQHLGRVLTEGEFYDQDDVPVSATINLDKEDDFYELDIWKMDYSPLKRYPEANEITILKWKVD